MPRKEAEPPEARSPITATAGQAQAQGGTGRSRRRAGTAPTPRPRPRRRDHNQHVERSGMDMARAPEPHDEVKRTQRGQARPAAAPVKTPVHVDNPEQIARQTPGACTEPPGKPEPSLKTDIEYTGGGARGRIEGGGCSRSGRCDATSPLSPVVASVDSRP